MIKVIAIYHGPNGWYTRAPGFEPRHYSRHEVDEYTDAKRVAGEYARDVGAQAVVEVFRWRNCFIALIN